jgi:hypothetical protein
MWTATEKYFPRVPIRAVSPLSTPSMQALIASRINNLAELNIDRYLLEINIRSADHVDTEAGDSKENEDTEIIPFNSSVQEHESVPSTDTAPSSPVESSIPLPPIPIPPLLEPLSQSLVNEISTIISQTENISNIDFISQLALSNDEMAYNLSMFSLYSALNNN